MNFTGSILLVDDEPHIRKYLGLILRQVGAPKISEASNGAEALAAFQAAPADLVLLDVNMPVMDGLETLRKLKEIDAECVVVMLTSLSNRQTVEAALALGAANYIRKDTPKDEIARALHEIIELCSPPPEPS
jgi:two-component system chemotaxis response regulator CheY